MTAIKNKEIAIKWFEAFNEKNLKNLLSLYVNLSLAKKIKKRLSVAFLI